MILHPQNSIINNDTKIREKSIEAFTNNDLAVIGGSIIDISYTSSQPSLSFILLPQLKLLSMQNRWLLWLSPQLRIPKAWFRQVQLPTTKMIQLNPCNSDKEIDFAEKALSSGNYSCVISWLSEIQEQDKLRLQKAAQKGNSHGFIIRYAANINSFAPQSDFVYLQRNCFH